MFLSGKELDESKSNLVLSTSAQPPGLRAIPIMTRIIPGILEFSSSVYLDQVRVLAYKLVPFF